MSREKYNQVIDDVHQNYIKETMFSSDPKWLESVPVMDMRTGEKSMGVRQYHRNSFVNMCKTNVDFSEKWGLKIEERDLSFEDRLKLVNYDKEKFSSIDDWISWYNNEPNEFFYMGINYTKETELTDLGVSTKLITITYNNETIEKYE